jgi:hypothetical protein
MNGDWKSVYEILDLCVVVSATVVDDFRHRLRSNAKSVAEELDLALGGFEKRLAEMIEQVRSPYPSGRTLSPFPTDAGHLVLSVMLHKRVDTDVLEKLLRSLSIDC